MTDPLSVLRAALSRTPPALPALLASAEPASPPAESLLTCTHILLRPLPPLPKATPTRFLRPTASAPPPGSRPPPSDVYPLESIVYAYLARAHPPAQYLRDARRLGLDATVSVVDRSRLVQWLEGRIPDAELSHLLPDVSAAGAAPAYVVPLDASTTTPPSTPPPNHIALLTPSATPGAPAAAGVKRRYEPNGADQEFAKRCRAAEVELKDRNSVLRGGKANDFTELRSSIHRRLKTLREPPKASARPAAPDLSKSTSGSSSSKSKSKNQVPIIMISSSPTSLITMHNVKRFLEDADFVLSSTARDLALAQGNTKPEDVIPVYRQTVSVLPSGEEQHRQIKYFVVDGVEALGKFGFGGDPWDRVVCVLTTGQLWQFKPYKYPDPRTLFHHVKGIFFQWTHEPPNAGVKDWNVSVLKIDQSRRHVDKSVVAQFWRELDAWTAQHKPWLTVQRD